MKSHVNIGLIGLGSIAETSHIKYLKAAEHAVLAAVADLDDERARMIAQKYDIPQSFQSAEEMLEKSVLDAVMICTPNQTHIPIAVKAAAKGIHVFMEKPIGTVSKEVEDYLRLAKDKNVLTMAGMTHRFRNDVRILKDFASKGTFGNPYYVKAKLFRRRGTPKGWFTNRSLAGGGALMDIGVHVLDLAWWLIGRPEAQTITGKTIAGFGNYGTKYVSSWESSNKRLNSSHVFDVEDFGSAWIRFKNGIVLSLEIAWAVNAEQDEGIQIEILGDKGGASLSPLAIYTEVDGLLSKQQPVFEDNDPFKDEIEHFIDCIRAGSSPLSDGEDGYEVLKMLMGIYESSNLGKEIRLN
ncbi:Gfo/Idh/MocA family oxidoreductase [Bacillus haikouensis]|uniref:Gfo/Idh/MocA family protein n=1 Tax=Bacillus haikouensis TaxID=1510468 RepID=UPI001553788D|nr:Gfo/Idh/MocA family oxidoreductase [Bacillus haikouensis]NQD65642.1 Gfo/Idh/MocA family oxidoreductase [Bacillus haikouensis]